jgi:FkbM family methyltransferase
MLRSLFHRLTANKVVQAELDRVVQRVQKYTGVGCGDGVMVSGEVAVLKELLRRELPDYCIIDGGANCGQFVNLARHLMHGERFKIHAFEPSSEAFNKLSRIASADTSVALNCSGLGAKKGEAVLYADQPGSQLASLSRRDLEHFAISFEHQEKITLTTVDDYCRENNIGEVHLLKLDVEGAEFAVLQGAVTMLAGHRISCVSFEFGGTNIDSRTYFRDIWNLLSSYGFKIYRITPSGYLYPLKKYNEYYEQFRTTNFAAFLNNQPGIQ